MSMSAIVLLVSVLVFGLVAVKVWWLMGWVKKQAAKDVQAEQDRRDRQD